MRTLMALLAVLVIPAIGLAIATAPYYSQFGVTDPLVIGGEIYNCLINQPSSGDVGFFCSQMNEFHLLAGVAVVTGEVDHPVRW